MWCGVTIVFFFLFFLFAFLIILAQSKEWFLVLLFCFLIVFFFLLFFLFCFLIFFVFLVLVLFFRYVRGWAYHRDLQVWVCGDRLDSKESEVDRKDELLDGKQNSKNVKSRRSYDFEKVHSKWGGLDPKTIWYFDIRAWKKKKFLEDFPCLIWKQQVQRLVSPSEMTRNLEKCHPS